MTKAAEGLHEVGRAGTMRAKGVLQKIMGESIDLPFNAYDHGNRLQFADKAEFGGANGSFLFDLGGSLKRYNAAKFDHQEAAEVFVEVKTRQSAGSLLADYTEFLRRAAIASSEPRYTDAWFIFYSNIPFGSNKGVELVDGTLLSESARGWAQTLKTAAGKLQPRIVLVIATDSFVTLLRTWVPDAT